MKNKTTKPAQPETVVYCGPTLRGIAKQYTPFTGGSIPTELQRRCEDMPLLRELIVPVEKYAEFRARLNQTGSKESMVFDRVKDLMKGEN